MGTRAESETKTTTPGKSRTPSKGPKTLAIDIGGTGLKASVLDEKGEMLVDRVRVETPHPCPPSVMLDALAGLVAPLPAFDRVSVGFPGVVREGRILTAANLGQDDWQGFDLAGAMSKRFGKPVRVLNDADMQGYAAIAGKGVELVITLGTGMGSALFRDGRLMPHMELAHHPLRNNKSYEQFVGDIARKKIGVKRWNKHVKRAIESLRALFHFDMLHIGGGNAKRVTFDPGPDVRLVSNTAGILGGIALWKDETR